MVSLPELKLFHEDFIHTQIRHNYKPKAVVHYLIHALASLLRIQSPLSFPRRWLERFPRETSTPVLLKNVGETFPASGSDQTNFYAQKIYALTARLIPFDTSRTIGSSTSFVVCRKNFSIDNTDGFVFSSSPIPPKPMFVINVLKILMTNSSFL